MKSTVPVFLVGSGRSGTRMIFKLLSGHEDIEVFHEYLCTHIQPVAAKYFMGLIDDQKTEKAIVNLHGAGIHYSNAKYWVDTSNKLSWIIKPLYNLFPRAKFIHVVRDGRKVTSSFYHKLAPEIYDDMSISKMQDWLSSPSKFPEPPPEKKYWWNIPQEGQPFYKEFSDYDQYQRICYHWTEVIRVIDEAFTLIPEEQKLTVKLEELTKEKSVLQKFLSFFDIDYSDEYFQLLQKPQNVFVPMDFKLTEKQLSQFDAIAGQTMKKLGYTEKQVYEVNY